MNPRQHLLEAAQRLISAIREGHEQRTLDALTELIHGPTVECQGDPDAAHDKLALAGYGILHPAGGTPLRLVSGEAKVCPECVRRAARHRLDLLMRDLITLTISEEKERT